MLTDEEIHEINNWGSETRSINAATLVGRLPAGTPVKYLYNKKNSYQIMAEVNGRIQKGYIVKEYKGQSTLQGHRINKSRAWFASIYRALAPYKRTLIQGGILFSIVLFALLFWRWFIRQKK